MTDSEASIEASVIPTALRDRDQWVCWRKEERDGKLTKVPVTSGTGSFASATDPDTWTAFETASDYVEAGKADGVGFVFTDEDSIVGVDLDDCRDRETGDVDDTARDIIERLDSYTEISPSGTGYHVLIKGDLPVGRNRRGSVELYDTARFFTVTGDHVDVTLGHVARRQDALEAIHREYVQNTDADTPAESATANGDDSIKPDSTVEVDLEDEALLEKARNASNGEKFEQLWSGDTAGYDSHSEADMALCCLLAFWTGGDRTRMDQLFRQSALLREKWDDIHYADGSTYGGKTIERAIATTSEFYDPASSGQFGESAATSGDERVVSSRDISGQSNTYLVEKNRLLNERVNELETTLEQKTDRITELEADLRELEDALSDRDDRIEHLQTQRKGANEGNEDTPAQESLWRLTKRFVKSNIE